MFDYLVEKRKFCIKLGQIISHEIVKPGPLGELRTVEELNSLNRYVLARTAVKKMHHSILIGDYNYQDLIDDVAVYIDERIPQAYAKWSSFNNSRGPSQLKVNASEYGLIYHLKESKEKPTKKASMSTKGKVVEEKIINTPTDNKTINEQVKEANYKQLVDYLNTNNIRISKEEFRAVLFAMNGMTIYSQTKAQAIKKASETTRYTQKDNIKHHIDEMGIVSERLLKTRKQFGKSQAIASSMLKSRLAREVDK